MSQRKRKRRKGKKKRRRNKSNLVNGHSRGQPGGFEGQGNFVGDPTWHSPFNPDVPSIIALIVANLFPLVAFFFFDWSLGETLVLYWQETLVIGGFAVLKSLCALGKTDSEDATPRIFLIPFFCFHFGAFCGIHGFFLLELFELESIDNLSPDQANEWRGPFVFLQMLSNVVLSLQANGGSWWVIGIAMLIVSHGISFVRNYIGRDEFKTATHGTELVKPYGRIALMHICILAVGFVIAIFGSPVILLIPFVMMKTMVDLFFHLLSHQQKEKQS